MSKQDLKHLLISLSFFAITILGRLVNISSLFILFKPQQTKLSSLTFNQVMWAPALLKLFIKAFQFFSVLSFKLLSNLSKTLSSLTLYHKIISYRMNFTLRVKWYILSVENAYYSASPLHRKYAVLPYSFYAHKFSTFFYYFNWYFSNRLICKTIYLCLIIIKTSKINTPTSRFISDL